MNKTSSEHASDATSSTAKPGRKSLQSGFSLLARGEPQIWFTGGMLVLCLTMIIGLVTLIVVSGLPTFWPKPIDLIVLNDGTLDIGQPQKTQIRQNNSNAAEPKLNLPSRYYRTANHDLTGRHFRWIDPNEASADGISTPEWAMVIERMSWGRLLGIPLSLSDQMQPAQNSSERLGKISESLDLVRAAAAADSNELSAKLVLSLEDLATLELSNALREQLKQVESGVMPQGEVQFQSASGSWQAASKLAPEDTIRQARVLYTAPSAVLENLQKSVNRTTQLRHQGDGLRISISRIDSRISRMRAAVRRAELDLETNLPRQVDEVHGILEMLEQAAMREKKLAFVAATLQESLVDDPETLQAATAWLDAYKSEKLPAEVKALETQLNDWLAPIREGPVELLKAVEDYQAEYRNAVNEKLPLQLELTNIEADLNLVDVNFAIPIGGADLPEFTLDDFDRLAKAEVTQGMRERLNQLGIDVVEAKFERVSEQLSLVRLVDSQSEPHLLAITLPGYVSQTRVLNASNAVYKATLLTEKKHACNEIVRAVAVNQLSLGNKFSVYFDRWREFLTENPRENTEGGVFPAIWGTVVMTLIMTIAVMPFGVMAALYLREYTQAGPLVSLIRISINNLAGVPSIVYGVFGFSFFCYLIGAFVDGGAKNADIIPMPPTIWFLALAATAVLGTSAFMFSFFGSGPSHTQTHAKRWMSKIALVCWLVSIVAIAILILKSPFFGGFYREYLPNPTFGKGGLLWAALTLSLLTLPVVIVATEEALAAVPNSLREGSLACGASKWQTIRRIVLPHARPGILTGAILAMARGAGEVAPLMLVGALPSAPDLPLDTEFPYLHASRSFMHLGYQIYTLGLQSPNSEAAKPMVFTCTLLLILIVAALNISAIYLRARLRRRFQGNQF
jgi:ABC-type phosphate transport system permease subunit/ABC-type phosphate transport system auxiliary subunit